MKKFTYTLDEDTVAALERAAERLSRPKSQVVREAIRFYGEHLDRLPEAHLVGQTAHHLDAPGVILVIAVGKIDPDDIHAGLDHVIEDLRLVRGRAERGNDFRASWHGCGCCD